jgi:hypothetical protein
MKTGKGGTSSPEPSLIAKGVQLSPAEIHDVKEHIE